MKRISVYGCLVISILFYIFNKYQSDNLLWSMLYLPRVAGLPSSYDGRKSNKVPVIKDQGDLGTCWAFASCMALEGALLPEESYDFSEDHMTLSNSFGLEQNSGGEYTMSMAYLLAWQGPVLEADDPYGDGYSPRGLKPVKHVQEIQILPEKDYTKIKRAVKRYGAVQSSLYTAIDGDSAESDYYNEETFSYYYPGDERPNHDIIIIGWDDHYSKDNFNLDTGEEGAFLCVTSWGNTFGDEGCFYVSYSDVNIGRQGIIYTVVEDIEQRNYIYQNDLCGWEGQIGYGGDSAYCANVYRSRSNETLNAVGFYATKPETQYEIYVSTDILGEVNFSKCQIAAKGNLANGGFYTIDLDTPIDLKMEERFAVILKIKTPGTIHPVAIEYPENQSDRIDVNDGKSYISRDGITWESTKEVYRCDVCLKAYTIAR